MAKKNSDGSIVLSTKIDTSGIKKGLATAKKELEGLKKQAKVAAAAVTALGVASGYLVKKSIDAFAEYEQLVGGVETLFKDSSEKVIEYANNAYKTAGLSANKYMETVTSFSASLLQSLGGDTDKAADVANMALIDMSDNANKMGTAMESIQFAYQGFSKQNYTMLDNLKLGYGGTKSEMERLLKDAEKLTGASYDISNLADVYNAIHAIQVNLKITGTTAEEAEGTISGSAATMSAAWENVLTAISGGGDLDRAIEDLVNSIGKYVDNILPIVERALIGVGSLIEKIAPRLVQTVANAFIKAIPQLISAVWQMMQGLFQGIKLALAEMLSGKTDKITEAQADNIQKAAEYQEVLAENVRETNKELKKSLAGFDDLQIITSGTTEDVSAEDTGSVTSSTSTSVGGDASKINGDELEQEVSSVFINLAEKVGKWLMALGCILLATGNITWGISLIIAGAIASEYSEAKKGDGSSLEELLESITGALAIAGILAIVLGLLLCSVKMLPKGIALIIIGASTIVADVSLNWNSIKEMLSDEKVASWITLAGFAGIVIGILLCVAQQWALGIGAIVLGAAAIVTTVVVNWDAITKEIKGVFHEWGGLIALAGAVFIIIGILVCCTGEGLPLGIALIAEGAISLVAVIALNWNSITNKVQELFHEWGGLIALAGVALIIIGILVCFINIPLGIGLIAAGAAALIGAVAFNWNAIVDWVKDAWKAVKKFWDDHIAQVFTVKFWEDLAKKCGNGLIGGFEAAVNGIIGLFESMINVVIKALNKISIDIPDWDIFGSLGGKTFGFNLGKANFKRLSIPRLAQGAVIPANREFLAVLGDQKRGTNVEAPAELIKQMAKEAMLEMGVTGQEREVIKEEHYYLDKTELMRIVYELVQGGERLNGTSLVKGGMV